MFMYYIQRAEHIIKLLYQPGTPDILVFVSKRRYPITREPLHLGHKVHKKFAVIH